jgi:segregation and condensation protein B
MTKEELAGILESLLLVSADPLTAAQVKSAVEGATDALVAEAFGVLEERFRVHTGIVLQKAASGWRLVTSPQNEAPLARYLKMTSRQRLSRAAFEVLAIVAYHQPITLPEISAVRGANSANAVNTLLEKKLVRIVGRKKVVGKPFLFGTTREFLLHFGLNSLEDLPRVEEMDAFKAE